MGMILSMVQFTAQKLQEYLDNPEHFEKDLSVLENSEEDPSCYLDKAWGAIHYLLTGSAFDGYLETGHIRADGDNPLTKAIYSDQFFDRSQDLGLGPAAYLTPVQVRQIHTTISSLDNSFVRDRYNPEDMSKRGVYPQFWENEPHLIDYINDTFNQLRKFYEDAASKGHAVASYLS